MAQAPAPDPSHRSEGPVAVDDLVVRHHQVVIAGVTIRYTTTTGRLLLRQERPTQPTEANTP